jgi:two-component system NtrC family sensor kinase
MAAHDSNKQDKPVTDRPASGRTPAALPAFISRLLALTSSLDPHAELLPTLGRVLDVMVELEPRAAAGIWLRGSGHGDQIVHRASVGLAGDAKRLGHPDGRLFPELAEERVTMLGAGVDGSLHFAAPSFERATIASYELLLEQAACIATMTIRMLRDEDKLRHATHSIVQLEKLAGIGSSAAGIVHELNNPLTAIVAYSDFLTKRLQDRAAPDTDVERLHRIGEAAQRIQRFCRELSDYARPGGKLREPIDLHATIDRALGFCMHGLRDADIVVERSYRDIPMMVGTDTQLTQVFVNLFTNAWHAMADVPGGSLRIATRLNGLRVVVEVADEGHGIEEHQLARIFDNYFTTKPKGKGVGLGLSIVKQIIDDHNGSIRAENRDSNGTIFYIELPVGMGE